MRGGRGVSGVALWGVEHPGLDQFEELVLGDLEIFGKLFGAHHAGHSALEGAASGLQELQGVAVVLFKGAGPGGLGLPSGLLKRLALQDQGGQLDRAVGWGGEATLGWGEQPGGGIEADDVAQETRYPLAFLGRRAEPRVFVLCLLLCHQSSFYLRAPIWIV